MILLLPSACLALIGVVTAQPTYQPSVRLSSGVIVGTTSTPPRSSQPVNRYLGIPFAASPPQRFGPPEDPEAWSTPLNASSFRPTCIQQFFYPQLSHDRYIELFNNPPLEESEDCLYLNVWTPSSPAPSNGRAKSVIMWFYGGTLQNGGANDPVYNGENFAGNQDIVFVTSSYRTGAFGFPGSPELPLGERNAGFLDQRKALEWVQANIAAFGGDPSKVTIFGESAGAYSVKQMLANPPDPLPFRAAILESLPLFGDRSSENWETLVQNTNCSRAPSQLSCMRDLPAEVVRNVTERQSLVFTLSDDNVTASVNVRENYVSGRAARVPTLVGFNANEGTVLNYLFGNDLPGVNARGFLSSQRPDATDEKLDAIIAAYPDEANDTFALLSRILTDLNFNCPLQLLTNIMTESKYDVWKYYYNATFPNLNLFPGSGVYHSSEIPIVFGTYLEDGATPQQVELSQHLQKIWADFAKDPTAGPGWPALGTNGGEELRVFQDVANGTRTVRQERIEGICGIYEPLITVGPI